METLKLKTNIKCSACVEKVTPGLNKIAGAGNWQVDLSDPQRTLTVQTDAGADAVKEELQKAGYKAERV